MPLTPYQLPNPREDTPYTLDLEAMREQASPFTNKVATDNLTNLRLTHNLQRQQYQDDVNAQHDYADRVLNAQRSDIALDAIPKFLAQPHGYNVMMGSPDIQRVLSGLSPDMNAAIGRQAFVGDQADIVKKLGDAMKAFTDAGGQLDMDKFSQLAGLTVNAGVPLPLQVEREKSQSAENVANIQAGKGTTPEYEFPGPPGAPGPVRFKALPNEPFEQTQQRARDTYHIPSLQLKPLPARPAADTPPPGGAQAAPKPAVPGKTSLPPAKQDTDTGPLTGAPFSEGQIAAIDPRAWDNAWQQLKTGSQDKIKANPEKYDNVERLTALRGGKPAVDKSGRIWGVDKNGKFTQYGADEL